MAYEFTQEGYRQFSEAIIAAGGDQATLTTVLADMQSTFEGSIGSLTAANKQVEDTTKENERLKSANMELFLRIGADPAKSPAKDPDGEQKQMSCKEYMDNYFNSLEGKK